MSKNADVSRYAFIKMFELTLPHRMKCGGFFSETGEAAKN